jgi:hypothetical protein
MPWIACSEGLSRRGPWKGATVDEHEAFLKWAEAYWQRRTPSSFRRSPGAVRRLPPEAKLRLQSRVEIAALLASGGNDLAQ